MEHSQLNNETETVSKIFENNKEVKCPFCDNTLTVPKDMDVEDVICGECCQRIGDFDFTKSTRTLGDLTL
jgi:hypothetical protein